MARESSKLGLNPGRYRRGIRAQVVQFGYEVRCFHCVLVLEIKCPMVSGLIWFQKGQNVLNRINKITTCESGPVSAWVEMAIACP